MKNEEFQILLRLVQTIFPTTQLTAAYGSSAIPQKSDSDTNDDSNTENVSTSKLESILCRPMMDLIFVVNDPYKWHRNNIIRNPTHYSVLMRNCGATAVNWLQSIGGSVYYNTLIPINWAQFCDTHRFRNDLMIKYGVISTSQLIQDLVYWDSLYIAGRLHKPVEIINADINNFAFEESNDTSLHIKELRSAIATKHSLDGGIRLCDKDITLTDAMLLNWDFVIRIALILLLTKPSQSSVPQSSKHTPIPISESTELSDSSSAAIFTFGDLFRTISYLSYSGDIRMKTGHEDTTKIDKIVSGAFSEFCGMYNPILKQFVSICDDDDVNSLSLTEDSTFICVADKYELMSELPHNLRVEMERVDSYIWDNLECDECVYNCLCDAISNIVRYSSNIQVMKGLFTAGVWKSIYYLLRKMWKFMYGSTPIDTTQIA